MRAGAGNFEDPSHLPGGIGVLPASPLQGQRPCRAAVPAQVDFKATPHPWGDAGTVRDLLPQPDDDRGHWAWKRGLAQLPGYSCEERRRTRGPRVLQGAGREQPGPRPRMDALRPWVGRSPGPRGLASVLQARAWEEGPGRAGGWQPWLIILDRPLSTQLGFIPGASFQ